ncbi:MAG: hypothetical protein HY513_05590 [Candidatus Aenigmarchaeota archaeon]|nr:hypothetical protein [Candidatus Aenigmarchaeota archaeon]
MKGFLEEGNTLLVVIFAVVVIVLASILIAIGTFTFQINPGSQIAEEFNVLGVKSHPYSLSELISHKRDVDRNLFEELLEASTAGLNKSKTLKLPPMLYGIAGKFAFIQFFEFKLKKNNTVLFITSNIPSRCGENDEGFCIYDPGYANVCDTGRVVIDGKGKCTDPATICCKYDPVAYIQQQGKNKIVKCGDNDAGICSGIEFGEGGSISCYAGLVSLEGADKICKNTNDGNTPICCAPQTSLFEERGQERVARVPFLYRGPALFEPKEYNCQSIFSKCSGEYITGLCDRFGNPNVQCCISEPIRCAPPNSKYLCRDTNTGCPTQLIDPVGSAKTCPGPETYRCCKIENPPEQTDASGVTSLDQPTLEEPKVLGKCILDDTPYYDQVLGELEVKVFEGQR